MTDPLGQSQVLPYLRGLTRRGHEIDVVSCEKPVRRAEPTSLEGLGWYPLVYHKRPPVLSTLWDVAAMARQARALHRRRNYQLVHCRGYLTALVGRRLGLPFVFDMRGFWPDERVDGGVWSLKNPLYALIYRYFKRQERLFLRDSAAVISLTHRGLEEMLRWGVAGLSREKFTVIPCCCDLEHFNPDRAERSEKLAGELELTAEDFVVAYLGSLGTWYLLEEMLDFFARFLLHRPRAKLVFFTPDSAETIEQAAHAMGVPLAALRVRRLRREEVPSGLALAHAGLFFIQPSYSKTASSPTKLGELLGMGLPVISNAGVGDSDWLAERFKIGPVVSRFDRSEYERAARELDEHLLTPGERRRAIAQEYFSLERGVELYDEVYQRVLKKPQ